MTVILDDQSNAPGTHVLIVAVGDYPFLKGGSAPEAQRFALHMSMGQLSSPPISAERFAHWLCKPAGYNNPQRPLRSLQMLVSEAGGQPKSWTHPDGTQHVLARARPADVRQAILNWKTRAGLNPDNLALFYFCGHGLAWSESENSLLLEDFGGNTANPMEDAIQFDQMRVGLMNQCQARFQCHFIDACRTAPTDDYTDHYGEKETGVAVVAGGINKKLRETVAPVFFATRLASAAYGIAGQPSLFTEGMLRSFQGAASRDQNDSWEVTVSAMAEGINKCVESMAFQTQPQFCQPLDTGQPLTLHRLHGPPEVMVKISTDDAKLPNTIFAHSFGATNQRVLRQPPLSAPWWVSLSLGEYTFEAIATDLVTVLGTRRKYVAPPGAEVHL